MPRRIFVPLPDAAARTKVLQVWAGGRAVCSDWCGFQWQTTWSSRRGFYSSSHAGGSRIASAGRQPAAEPKRPTVPSHNHAPMQLPCSHPCACPCGRVPPQVILKDEAIDPGFSVAEVAAWTDGYSSSDLRNLCIAAAYFPIRRVPCAHAPPALPVGPGPDQTQPGPTGSAGLQCLHAS